LCEHASKMGKRRLHRPRSHADGGEPPQVRHAEWSAIDGTVTLNWGQWTMHAAPGTLTLRAEAGNEENLKRLQDLLTARLEKIGRRDRLAVNWQEAETPGEAGLLPGCQARARQPDVPPTALAGRGTPCPGSSGRCSGKGEVRQAAPGRSAGAAAPRRGAPAGGAWVLPTSGCRPAGGPHGRTPPKPTAASPARAVVTAVP
jgi:hypothetical protein